MTTFLLVAGLALLALAVVILVQAFAAPRAGSKQVMEQIGAYGFRGFVSREETADRGESALAELPARIGAWISRHFGSRGEAETRRRLISAGLYSTSPTAYVGYRLIGAIALGLGALLFAAAVGMSTVIFLLFMVVSVLLGWYLPSIVVNRRMEQRHQRIERELPELIDLLVVTVEAGIGFTGALRLAVEELEGPLAQEVRLTLQEQSMGLAMTEALDNLAYRVDTTGVKAFVRGISQGETLGVSISQILRNIADEMRKARKARAEELAQKAPVKMLFPLVFLIFPAMFVVLLLPAILQISKTLGS